jgi:integrase
LAVALLATTLAKRTESLIARVLAFGLDRGEIEANVLANFSRAYKSNRADKIWLPKDIEAFSEVAAPELVVALTLALHTGQRQGDLLRLRWTDFSGTSLSLRQSKTGVAVTIPCTTELRTLLSRMKRTAETILTAPSGRPWTTYYFRHRWAAAAKAAKIVDLHFHDLRGTATTLLAEAGCTIPEIAAITGHKLESVSRILETYLSKTAKLSGNAIAKLDRHFRRMPPISKS